MYDPAYIAQFYDDYGEQEWERLETTPANRVSFHVHRWFLQQYIRPGDHVLEIGAGPGRFTIELARLGARITVGDISPKQLDLNRIKVGEAGVEEAVAERHVLDVVDLSRFSNEQFDAVVCYGGPVSYVFDRADDAIGEMLRVTKANRYVLLSVMSLLGTTRRFMPGVLETADQFGLDAIQRIIASGDLAGLSGQRHECRMYRWSDLSALLGRHSGTVVAASAANFLSTQHEELVASLIDDATLWQAFLDWELDFCREPGALDGGTHIIAVVQRSDDDKPNSPR